MKGYTSMSNQDFLSGIEAAAELQQVDVMLSQNGRSSSTKQLTSYRVELADGLMFAAEVAVVDENALSGLDYDRVPGFSELFSVEPITSDDIAADNTIEPLPDISELRESLFDSFELSHKAHVFEAAFIKGAEILTMTAAQELLKTNMTDEALANMQADIEKAQANPESGDTEFGYIPVFSVNGSWNEAEQDKMSVGLQKQPGLSDYGGDPYKYEPMHGQATASTARSGTSNYRVQFASLHRNIPEADAVTQALSLREHNATNSTTKLASPDDVEHMNFAYQLAHSGRLNDPETRFINSYARRVEQAIDKDGERAADIVARSCVSGVGRWNRDFSIVDYPFAGRALVETLLDS